MHSQSTLLGRHIQLQLGGDSKPSFCPGLRCGHWLTDAGCGGVRGEAGGISSAGKSQDRGEKSLPQFPEAPVGGHNRPGAVSRNRLHRQRLQKLRKHSCGGDRSPSASGFPADGRGDGRSSPVLGWDHGTHVLEGVGAGGWGYASRRKESIGFPCSFWKF